MHSRRPCVTLLLRACRVAALFIAAALVANHSSTALATTYAWTGAAGNNLWSGNMGGTTNWSPNFLPPSNQSIAFVNATSFPVINLQTDRTINDVTFGGTQNYTLTGGTLAVTSGAITANGGAVSTTHSIEVPLTIGAAGIFNVGSPATLAIRSGVSDGANSYGLTKTGAGTLTLAGATSNLHSLTATEGTLNIDNTTVTARLGNNFGFDFQTTTNVTHGAKLLSAMTGFLKVAGSSLPLLTLDGQDTAATGSTYFIAGYNGVPGAIDIRNRASVSTGLFIVSVGNEGPVASTALIHDRASVTAGALSIGGAAGALGSITVFDAGTTVVADSVLLGGFNSSIFGGTTTMTVKKDSQVTANVETTFFTTTSTLIVDGATFTTPRLNTSNGALPLIQLTNPGPAAALQITNADVATPGSFAGVIEGSGGIRKTGAGEQTLSGHNTYAGGTRIEAGTLKAGAGDALPNAGVLEINGGALDLGGHAQHIGDFKLTAGTLAGAVGSTLVAANVDVFAGAIAAPLVTSAAVTKQGAGTVTATAPITADAVVVFAGVLDVQAGVKANVNSASGAQFKFRQTLDGFLLGVPGSTTTLTGASVVTGLVQVNGTLEVGSHTLALTAASDPSVASTTIAGGVITSPGVYTLSSSLSGYGSVMARLGSPAAIPPASITALGGPLTLGTFATANSLSGYTGSLTAGVQQLTLLSSGFTTLGNAITVAGGSINSINGVQVNAGKSLSGFGAVNGPLKNLGVVTGGSGPNVLRFTGPVTGGGSFQANVRFENSYSPGASPAAVSFVGDPVFAATSRLEVELGGRAQGTQYDYVDVTGKLTLGGTLCVSLIDNFTPIAGDEFDILDWTTLDGAFATVELPTLSGFLWDISQLHVTGSLRVIPLYAADFDSNGRVDAADLTVWRNGFGNAGGRAAGDATGDGRVTGDDLMVWQRQLGSGVMATSATASVPEPATALLLAACGLALCAACRRAAKK